MREKMLCLMVLISMTACSSARTKMGRVVPGMDRADVIDELGTPSREVKRDDGSETMVYRLATNNHAWGVLGFVTAGLGWLGYLFDKDTCYVNLQDDKVSTQGTCPNASTPEQNAAMWRTVAQNYESRQGSSFGDYALRSQAQQTSAPVAPSYPPPTGNLTCGIAPIPKIGCQIGRCVNGRWEQVCD